MLKPQKIKNIGFLSTRFQGTDGVSLETEKWVAVLNRMGYACYFYAGLSDWDKKRTMVFKEAFFDHPAIKHIQDGCYNTFTRTSSFSGKIHRLRKRIKTSLYKFIDRFDIDMLIVENALAIPLNIPLGLAITEFIAETGLPTIGHHHDLPWERERFIVNSINDYIRMAFPPSLPNVLHVSINSQAQKELSYRRGLSSVVIPNVFNFREPPPGSDEFSADVRKSLGLKDDDFFFLQPTRIVARKGIEHTLELVNRLEDPRIKVVITHMAKDEGKDYLRRIREYARLLKVPLIIKPEIIGKERKILKDGRKQYTLWDIYPHCDLVTYPSTFEGFGNAFLETLYFKKPILVNRYSIYKRDIEPAGFDVITMDNYVTDTTVRKVAAILKDPARVQKMVAKNYRQANKYFSYEVLQSKLKAMLVTFEGV